MVPYNAYLALKGVNDTVSTWVPSVTDCLAEDWYVIEYRQRRSGGAGQFNQENLMNMATQPASRGDDETIEQEIQRKGKTAPRITPADIEATIVSEWYFTAGDGVAGATGVYPNHGHPGHRSRC